MTKSESVSPFPSLPAPQTPPPPPPPAAATTGPAGLEPEDRRAAAFLGPSGDESKTGDAVGLRLDDGLDLARELSQATRRLGKAVSKLVRQLGRLQDEADRLADKLTRDLDKDIGQGRFEDRSPGNLVSKLIKGLQQFREANEASGPRLFDNLYDFLKATGAIADVDGTKGSFSFSSSQTVSLSVESLNVNVDDDGGLSVSYQKIAFSVTRTVSASVSGDLSEFLGRNGEPTPAADAPTGLYLDPAIEPTRPLLDAIADDGEAEAEEAEDDRSILLLRSYQRSQSFQVASILLDIATGVGGFANAFAPRVEAPVAQDPRFNIHI